MQWMQEDSYQATSPEDRIFRALETTEAYGLEIPIELLDTSPEDGTIAGKKREEIEMKMSALAYEWCELAVGRLQSYREALGMPSLSQSQIDLAIRFFRCEMALSQIEGELAVFSGTTARSNADAYADLKRALFEGMYEEVEP